MAPYDERTLFTCDKITGEDIEPEVWPQFHWDYYQDWRMEEMPVRDAGECFTIMGPDGYVLSRDWYNGQDFIDQRETFEAYCRKSAPEWEQQGYRCFRIDYHW